MTEPKPRAAPGKLIGLSAVAPDVIFFLDDAGKVFSLYRDGMGQWQWRAVVMPAEIEPYDGQKQEQWKPFGSKP